MSDFICESSLARRCDSRSEVVPEPGGRSRDSCHCYWFCESDE